ncbi:MAG: phosphotransferase, partial [Aeromicrobium sp.]
DRLTRLTETFAALPEDHPAHVPADLRSRLLAARGEVADAADELEESTLPATWQHGDLHPWNVFAADGRLFDFGDGQWAHAAELLSVPYGWIMQRGEIAWPELLEEYADAWDVKPADLESQWRATSLTQPVNRTLLWWGCLQEASAGEWTQWGDSLLHHLSRVLER